MYHCFCLKDPNKLIAHRQYNCLRRYREAFSILLQQHLDAGRLRLSSSPYSSPCFLVSEQDKTVLPCWVNNYRVLNDNTVPDVHLLPSIPEILTDCGKGHIWGKIDMTNSFFQTRVAPEDIPYTAIATPWELYEWTVMPQGCQNVPATHQRQMFAVLQSYIGKICHVYMDNIIIWSANLDEHRQNVATILSALCTDHLFCSPKKTELFSYDLHFLGHRISLAGIEPDGSKVNKVQNWPIPQNATQVCSFLRLVCYMSSFLPHLSDYTIVLNKLTTKEAEKSFVWTDCHSRVFDTIKALVTLHKCLTVIDHNNIKDNKVFVSTNVFDFCTGALLSFGPTLETARLVAFESQQLQAAELNYHEKELLAIVRALKKWCCELLGVPFVVYTDHCTLKNFNTQKLLSLRQA